MNYFILPLLLLLNIGLTNNKLLSQDPSEWATRDFTTNFTFDNYGNKSIGIDYTHSIFLINYGASYELWVGNNRYPNSTELTIYGGIGLLNAFQIQFGMSTLENIKLRARSVIDPWVHTLSNDWWKYVSFVIDLEKRYGNNESYMLGIGAGYSIRGGW